MITNLSGVVWPRLAVAGPRGAICTAAICEETRHRSRLFGAVVVDVRFEAVPLRSRLPRLIVRVAEPSPARITARTWRNGAQAATSHINKNLFVAGYDQRLQIPPLGTRRHRARRRCIHQAPAGNGIGRARGCRKSFWRYAFVSRVRGCPHHSRWDSHPVWLVDACRPRFA